MLSILCVSDLKARALPFVEDMRSLAKRLDCEFVLVHDGVDVHSKGYIESVLDDAIALTHGDYILRLDDDERCSPAMIQWLESKAYEQFEHWSFPRAHFWHDPQTMILEQYYFPDLQIRLSTRAKSGGRHEIHAGSPWGLGQTARVCIEHWVYLAKSYEERCATAARYLQIRAGADGGPFRACSIEDEHPEGLQVVDYTDGLIPMESVIRHTGPIRGAK